MAKVSLRGYIREIEGMIEGSLLEESIAHCQHILGTFPMYVETYRLMGKSYLESRRYLDAADIFQRVLMAIPDDFVSHVGMSIIRDDEGKLDEAIWHMERAFEVQPSNPAIQAELRRLYGRRDGVEPHKIRLSKDALANLYAQGELFNQAIAEIRAVLAEDDNRPDLQVMLARAYFHAGQKIEAAEMSAKLLKKYMYCLDALRILVDVLPETARSENVQVYRQRLQLLDPYSAYVTGSTFNSSQVSDSAVNLERLEYKEGTASVLSHPDWASSLGIKLVEDKQEETIPDWMRNADWKESGGIVQGEMPGSDQEQPEELIMPADIPDWLKAMAPKEMTGKEESGREPEGNEKAQIGKEENTPDWRENQVPKNEGAVPEASKTYDSSEGSDGFPDWLKEISQDATGMDAPKDESDSLQPSLEQEPPETKEPAVSPVSSAQPVQSLEPAAEQEEVPVGKDSKETKTLEIEDDTMAWLESLAAKQGAKEEELLTKPGDRSEEMPEWLRSAEANIPVSNEPPQPRTSEEEQSLESFPPVPEQVPVQKDEPAEETPPMPDFEENIRNFNIEQDTKAWLDSLADEEVAAEKKEHIEPSIESEEIPEWLSNVEEQSLIKTVEVNQPSTQGLPTDAFSSLSEQAGMTDDEKSQKLASAIPSEEEQPLTLENDINTKAWLENLASREPVSEEGLFTKEIEQPEELPEWLETSVEQTESEIPETPQEIGEGLEAEIPPSSSLQAGIAGISPPEERPSMMPSQESPPEPPKVEDDALAWLKSIAEGEQASVEEILKQEAETPVEGSLGKGEEPKQELPVQGEVFSQENEQEDIAFTTWLKKQDVKEALEQGKPSTGPSSSSQPSQETESIPEWLRAPVGPFERKEEAISPSDIVDETASGIMEDVSIPAPQPSPTKPGEWLPIDEKPAPESEIENEIETDAIPVAPPTQVRVLGGTGMLSRIPIEDKDSQTLGAAQTALDANRLDEAMQHYLKLIKKNRLLGEVIHDLREAIYRYPVDVSVWQTLGDASMRSNQLQDALDAYTRAEELLR